MEEWKEITDYPNYEISNLGNVRNKTRNKINKTWLCKGYYGIILQHNKKKQNFRIHRLLAEAFIPNPNNLPVIDHIDKNKLNNSLNNLRWVSISQNSYNKKCKNNTSKFRGVAWDKDNNKWKVSIYISGKSKHIGMFKTEEEGARAFNEFVISHNLQEFVDLNII